MPAEPFAGMTLTLVDGSPADSIPADDRGLAYGDGVFRTLAMRSGIVQLWGRHYAKLAVSSTKSMTGHLLGAAGGIEAVFSILAIRDQVAPPTINLVNQDPQCDLDYVPNTARQMKINVALSNSFGFGGTNGSLVFRKI